MKNQETETVLKMLHNIVRDTYHAFPRMIWKQKQFGHETNDVIFDKGFHNLVLERNTITELTCRLEMPDNFNGIKLDGEPILVRISSIYPIKLMCNNEMVFEESGVPVAAGPVLKTWVKRYDRHAPPLLKMVITVPNQHPVPAVYLHCYTPSLIARFEQLDIAWARLAWANRIAETPKEEKMVKNAAQVAYKLCHTTNEQEIKTLSLNIAHLLAPLHDKAQKMQIHLIGHAHIDIAWLWRLEDTKEVVKRDFHSILKLMDEFPELTISFSQPAIYEMIQKTEPEMFAKVLELIHNNRWEATTMQWVEGDLNLASGEAQVRQMLKAVRYSREELKISPTVFHAPDTFGHSGNIPQLAVSAGAKFYYHHRANPGGEDFHPAYWWEGDDGTKILAFSSICYNGEISASAVVMAAIRAHRAGHPCGIFFHGIGDHGGGPSRHNLNYLRRLKKEIGLPYMICSREDAYCSAILDANLPLPIHKGESTTTFEGCYTTHADTKRYNRRSEILLTTADTLTALTGSKTDPAIENAWKITLLNQFHDILAGSSISDVYKDQSEDFAHIKESAETSIENALKYINRTLPQDAIAVTNPLGFDRTDIVCLLNINGNGTITLKDPEDNFIVGQFIEEGLIFMANVKAFSTSRYRIETNKTIPANNNTLSVQPSFAPADYNLEVLILPPKQKEKPFYKIETPFYIAYIRRNSGIIVSLIDKRVNKQLVYNGISHMMGFTAEGRPDLGLNVFQIIQEAPHGMSAWNMHEHTSTTSLLSGATVEVIESGPLQCRLRVRHTYGSTHIKEDIIFYNDIPRIDFRCKIDWQEKASPKIGVPGLKISFNTRMQETEAWFETPYAAVRRPADGQETPTLRWADTGGKLYGAALINDCKYGYDIMGTRMRLTLIRNAYEPDPQSDLGEHICAWSYVPHPGDWRHANIPDIAAEFNQPMITRHGNKHQIKDMVQAEEILALHLANNTSARITSIKPAEDGNGIVIRIAETHGCHTLVTLCDLPNLNMWYFCDITERLGDALTSASFKLRPWQVVSLRKISVPCHNSVSLDI